MPPKPRPVVKDGPSSTAKTPSQAMPPPPLPVPQPPPQPQGILVPEAMALSTNLRCAAVKASQIYGFYADAKRLGINRHAPYPPRSLISSLGRDVEKYDQLCDAVQSHLQRAITVLKRDLAREENRQRMAEAEAAAKAAASAAQPASLPHSPTIPEPPPTSPVLGAQPHKTSTLPMRRQSTISLSSLHRPPFPHKLDLSAASLRLNPDDPMQNGLASPVTLAPKSSMPKVASDFPFGSDVDIDLTVGDDTTGVGLHASSLGDASIGNSADKPIELDLDIEMNLFNASTHHDDNIRSGPLSLGEPSAAVQVKQEDHQIDLEFFKSLQDADSDTSVVKDDLLASLDTTDLTHQSDDPMDTAHDILSAMQPASNSVQPGIEHLGETVASPGTLLAGFEAAVDIHPQGPSDTQILPANGENYEFDLGLLTQMDSMQGLFNIPSANAEGSEPQAKPAS